MAKPTGNITRNTTYTTSDGQVFASETDARKHEFDLTLATFAKLNQLEKLSKKAQHFIYVQPDHFIDRLNDNRTWKVTAAEDPMGMSISRPAQKLVAGPLYLAIEWAVRWKKFEDLGFGRIEELDPDRVLDLESWAAKEGIEV